MKRTGNEMKKN